MCSRKRVICQDNRIKTKLHFGTDTLVEIEFWAKEKQDWQQQHLRLPHGISSHKTVGCLLNQMDPQEFIASFQRWVRGQLPQLADMVASDRYRAQLIGAKA